MTYQSLTPMLETNDLSATKIFYTSILGFECEAIDEENGWMSLKKDAATIMFSKPNLHRNFTQPIMSGSIYITLLDVDILWNSINNKVNVCYPIEDFSYGMREFAIFDNNGYLLQFGTELT